MADLEEQLKGIEPIHNSPEEQLVVPINYNPDFALAFGRFRRVLQDEEVSERALLLTEQCARLNPANYTVWQYRRQLLEKLGKDLHKELGFVSQVIEDNPKNYQIWHHRRTLCEKLKDGSKEVPFTTRIFNNDDAKNYHAWQHRQWAVEAYGLWEGERAWASEMLRDDIRNNSVWNYRFFLLNSGPAPPDKEALLRSEIEYTWDRILEAPHNESAWAFLGGLLVDGEGTVDVLGRAEGLYASGCRAAHLLAFLHDSFRDNLEKKKGEEKENKARIEALLNELVEKDPIRHNYWESLKIK